MRPWRHLALLAITFAAFVARDPCAWARGADAPAQGAQVQDSQTRDSSDQTLEIPKRIAPPAPAAESAAPADAGTRSAAPGDDATGPVTSGDETAPLFTAPAVSAPPSAAAAATRPYLGIAVQTIYSNDRPGGLVNGLEVVSVDPDSPADRAGLRGRTHMTSVGESGATVGSLMPPLNLLLMPLLKKTGSLGQSGDLIVAIDDRRVVNEFDLQSELATLKPGETIYLTIVRALPDGSKKTLKVPIRLANAAQTAASSEK
jgi:PDZ domain